MGKAELSPCPGHAEPDTGTQAESYTTQMRNCRLLAPSQMQAEERSSPQWMAQTPFKFTPLVPMEETELERPCAWSSNGPGAVMSVRDPQTL